MIQKVIPADFDEQIYLELNPDVAQAGMNATLHYLQCGINENRQYKRKPVSDRQRVSERWANLIETQNSKNSWLDSSTVNNYINFLISGDKNVTWFNCFINKYFPREVWGGRGLVLGCNHGLFDRQVIKSGICSKLDAYDISEKSIEIARETAAQEHLNIHYEVADINNLELPSDCYDLVIVTAAVHHFEKLEEIFTRIHNSLKKNGYFIFNEYVGTKRFQWSDAQLKVINALREQLPPELTILSTGLPAPPVQKVDIDALIKADPSEAIRSDEIVNLTYQYFKVIEHWDYGGTILHMFFHEIIKNFDESNSTHVAIIKLICSIEKILLEQKILSSDHTVMISRRHFEP